MTCSITFQDFVKLVYLTFGVTSYKVMGPYLVRSPNFKTIRDLIWIVCPFIPVFLVPTTNNSISSVMELLDMNLFH